MPDLSALSWALLAVGALLVGLSKTAVPGAATISVALFAAALPARASTGVLLVLLMVGDLFAVWTYRAHADLATLRRLVPAVLLGVVAGTAFLALAGDEGVRRTIGVILLTLIALTLVQRARGGARRRTGPSAGPRHRLVTGSYGVLGGFTTMVANSGGPVMSLYFLASSYSINRFLGTAAWFFFAVNLVKVPFSVSLGLLDAASLRLDLVLVPAVVAGAVLGRPLARRLNQRVFDRLVIGLTTVSATYLVVS